MPSSSRQIYQAHQDTEYLSNDGWQNLVEAAELNLLSPRQWYLDQKIKAPAVDRKTAPLQVNKLLQIGTITSSDPNVD